MFNSSRSCPVCPQLSCLSKQKTGVDIISLLFHPPPTSLSPSFSLTLNPFQPSAESTCFPGGQLGKEVVVGWVWSALCSLSFRCGKQRPTCSQLSLRASAKALPLVLVFWSFWTNLFCSIFKGGFDISNLLSYLCPKHFSHRGLHVSVETRSTHHKALVSNMKCWFPPQPWPRTAAGKKKGGWVIMRLQLEKRLMVAQRGEEKYHDSFSGSFLSFLVTPLNPRTNFYKQTSSLKHKWTTHTGLTRCFVCWRKDLILAHRSACVPLSLRSPMAFILLHHCGEDEYTSFKGSLLRPVWASL